MKHQNIHTYAHTHARTHTYMIIYDKMWSLMPHFSGIERETLLFISSYFVLEKFAPNIYNKYSWIDIYKTEAIMYIHCLQKENIRIVLISYCKSCCLYRRDSHPIFTTRYSLIDPYKTCVPIAQKITPVWQPSSFQ